MSYMLTASDKEEIEAFDDEHKHKLMMLEQLKKFKVGDYLVAYKAHYSWDELKDEGTKTFQPLVNNLEEPNKYNVVYINDCGVPFIKLVNINGKIQGGIISAWDIDEDLFDGGEYYFELDPSYVDSILLGQPYDPYANYKEKLKIHDEIKQYNRSIKIKNGNLDILTNFFITINVGDIVWTSSKRYLQVEAKEQVKVRDVNNMKINVKGSSGIYKQFTEVKSTMVTVLTVRHYTGKSFKIVPDYLSTRTMYTKQPRSIGELDNLGELNI